MTADEIEIIRNRIAMESQLDIYHCTCNNELAVALNDLERLQQAFEFMASTGTHCVPGRRDVHGKIMGWDLRKMGGYDVEYEFSREFESPRIVERNAWPPWDSPVDALLAYRDWLLKRDSQ